MRARSLGIVIIFKVYFKSHWALERTRHLFAPAERAAVVMVEVGVNALSMEVVATRALPPPLPAFSFQAYRTLQVRWIRRLADGSTPCEHYALFDNTQSFKA